MDARELRLAKNESLFRSVNERIEEAAASSGIDDHLFEFFCECSNTDCNLLVPMTLSEYEQVRADPTQFIVAPGHGTAGDRDGRQAHRRLPGRDQTRRGGGIRNRARSSRTGSSSAAGVSLGASVDVNGSWGARLVTSSVSSL